MRGSIALGKMCSTMIIAIAIGGCQGSGDGESGHEHSHDVPAHMPHSLAHLCIEIRERVEQLDDSGSQTQLQSELADLVSWAPEFAADTDVSERMWQPIYDLSEQIRQSIHNDPNTWDSSRKESLLELCQISRDAWRTLEPHQRIERYQGHHHHGHDHHDHGHGPEHDERDHHSHADEDH